jgi:diacylglycerol kinase (ATP)
MIWFIVNPVAGNGSGRRMLEKIQSFCQRQLPSARVLLSEYPGHSSELARQAVAEGARIVAAVGGDGTAREVAAVLRGSETALAILPCGTGNDFIKTAGIPRDFDAALNLLLEGSIRRVDMGLFNDTPFLNAAGAGFDADVIANVDRFKRWKLRGLLAYGTAALYTLSHLQTVHMCIETEEGTVEEDSLLLVAANGRMIGGGMCIAPQAQLADGLFDVCHVLDVPLWKIPYYLVRLIRGTHTTISYCRYYKARSLRIRCSREVNAQIDGELCHTKDFTMQVLPGALRLVMPGV